MAYQVKTTTSYGNRLLNSAKGTVAGFIIFIIGTILLFANEGNYVKTDKAIRSAQKELINVSDVSTVEPSLNGKLIHATALADTQDTLSDPQFGVSEKAIAVVRTVEYYQYSEISRTETRDKLGGGEEKITTYSYEKRWVMSPINSGGFADPNYKNSNYVLESEIKSQTQYATNVSFGAYKLPDFIIKAIRGSVSIEPKMSDSDLRQWNNRIAKRMTELGINANGNAALVHVQGNVIYLGKSSSSPEIGDMRVTLTKILPAEISIIAKVVGSTFEEYIAPNGRTFSYVDMGTVSADNMIESAKKTNSVLTWIFRLIGLLLVVFGLKMLFNILPTLFKVLPFLGSIVGAGVGLVCSIGGFAWSLLIISLAWLFYRPLIGVPLLLAAIVGIWFLSKKAKTKAAVS